MAFKLDADASAYEVAAKTTGRKRMRPCDLTDRCVWLDYCNTHNAKSHCCTESWAKTTALTTQQQQHHLTIGTNHLPPLRVFNSPGGAAIRWMCERLFPGSGVVALAGPLHLLFSSGSLQLLSTLSLCRLRGAAPLSLPPLLLHWPMFNLCFQTHRWPSGTLPGPTCRVTLWVTQLNGLGPCTVVSITNCWFNVVKKTKKHCDLKVVLFKNVYKVCKHFW